MRQKMDAPCRRPLLEIAPLVFGKWYYAALAKETILSPANLFALDLQKDSDAKIEYAYIMNTKAAEEQSDLEFTSEYHFSLMTYSTQKHPLVADLQALISYCTPDRATDENGMLLEEEKKEILAQLSLRASFIWNISPVWRGCWGFWFPCPPFIPEGYSLPRSVMPFRAAHSRYPLSAGGTACTLASERFIEAMDLEDGIAPPDFFYHLLESNQEVDRIFIDFYKRVDVDIEEIWRTPPEKLNAEERSIVSSFLFTGIMLDKWFLTPMSVFFRFIRPIAFTPMQFYPLVNTLASLILMEHNVGAELFTPPTYYSLTALGKELFADPDIIDVDKQQMPQTMPYEQLQAAVLQEAEAQEQELLFLTEVVPDVLSLKISQSGDADLWKLSRLGRIWMSTSFAEISAAAFALEDMADYLLSVPDRNGFPLEYSANGSKRSLNKANGKMLQELPLSVGTTAGFFTPPIAEPLTSSWKFWKRARAIPYLMYPRVTEQSPENASIRENGRAFLINKNIDS